MNIVFKTKSTQIFKTTMLKGGVLGDCKWENVLSRYPTARQVLGGYLPITSKSGLV